MSASRKAAGTSRTATAPGPKLSTTRPSRSSSRACSIRRVGIGGIQFDDRRDQQKLTGDARRRPLFLQPLVDEPLMGGMLIDDDDAVARLGDDIGVVHLRPRRAERGGEVGLAGAIAMGARIGGGRPGSQSGLRLFGEAGWRGAAGAAAKRASPSGAAGRRRAPKVAPRQRGERRRPAGRRGAMQRRFEALLQSADEEAAHQARIVKAHFGLGRVDVDIDEVRVAAEKQDERRVPAGRQIVQIGAAHRAVKELVADRPAVDEEILRARVGAVEGRQAGEAVEARPLRARPSTARALARNSRRATWRDTAREDRRVARRAGRPFEAAADIAGEGKADLGMGHGEALDGVGDGLRLGPVAFQEFEPRRRRGEEIAHFDARAGRMRRGRDRALAAGIDANRQRHAAPRARLTISSRATEAIEGSASPRKPSVAMAVRSPSASLRGRMALDGEVEIVGGHAAAVVDDANEAPSALLDDDFDAASRRHRGHFRRVP